MLNVRVSIVVPIYNQEEYLDRSISSILNQSYSNLDIVLVNDGSTDASIYIIEKYASEDSRIKTINKENGGLVDATIAGIKASDGDYIAFLDPDDYIGSDFIQNFIEAMDQEYDFIAMGFYYEKHGTLKPYLLKENRTFFNDDVIQLRKSFLIAEKSPNIPNDLFISRWNKIYSRKCIQKVIDSFSQCKGISLGEDSIFTYLMLSNCSYGKTVRAANTYFYNIGNQNSMMSSYAVEHYIKKAAKANTVFSELLLKSGEETDQAYALYFHLIDALLIRVKKADTCEYRKLLALLKQDRDYKKAIECMSRHSSSKKELLKYIAYYFSIYSRTGDFFIDTSKRAVRRIKVLLDDIIYITKSIPTGQKFSKTKKMLQFQIDRRNAFVDLARELPEIEKRVAPFLQSYVGKQTDLSSCSVEKNVFVFWWEGFEKAPDIVKACLNSVKKYYSDCNIIEITKDNYSFYADINPLIIEGYLKKNVSVQTFSDILRFNLLKIHGGMWVDATLFFTSRCDLFESLAEKSFESVQFSSSSSFLEYKDNFCSWSGFLIASRKSGLLVSAADYLFEKYYLEYKSFPIYFFIDALLMILKINQIDDNVLAKVKKIPGDMFILSKIISEDYNKIYCPVISAIPQKLQWGIKLSSEENNILRRIIELNEVN